MNVSDTTTPAREPLMNIAARQTKKPANENASRVDFCSRIFSTNADQTIGPGGSWLRMFSAAIRSQSVAQMPK